MPKYSISIDNRTIGPGAPCYVIAEAGVNHNGDINIAHQLVGAAKSAAADAVKFQAFSAEDLVTADAPKAEYQLATTKDGGRQFEMLKSLELTVGELRDLKIHCDEIGITFICTPYGEKSADILDYIGVAAFKVASTDTTNIPFLRNLARYRRPVILSTGMCDLAEVEEAVAALEGVGDNLALLHCTSEYPAAIEETNLRAVNTLAVAFGYPVGYSDHTEGIDLATWAVVAGASIIEKHFTLDREMDGPDHRASIEPKEMAALIELIRLGEAALGTGIKCPLDGEIANRDKMRKSLVAACDIGKGQIFGAENLTAKRPGTGLPPKWLDLIAGKRAEVDITADTILRMDFIDWDGAGK